MPPETNYLKQSLILSVLVLASLLVLYAIPEFDLGPFHFRRINILADIMQKEKTKELPIDSSQIVRPVYVDTCKTGITCVEDYSKDTSGMTPFLSALDSAN